MFVSSHYIIPLCTELLWTSEIRRDDRSTFADLSWLAHKQPYLFFHTFFRPVWSHTLGTDYQLAPACCFTSICMERIRELLVSDLTCQKRLAQSALCPWVCLFSEKRNGSPPSEHWGLGRPSASMTLEKRMAMIFRFLVHWQSWHRVWFSQVPFCPTKRWERTRTACVTHYKVQVHKHIGHY